MLTGAYFGELFDSNGGTSTLCKLWKSDRHSGKGAGHTEYGDA
jgi:hypothetical protein